MKKTLIIISFLLLCVVGVYIYIRYRFLHARNFKPDNSKAKNVLDLSPAIIAKLQQIVKDGSEGLYILSIEKLKANILTSQLDVVNASLNIDTSAMLKLDKLNKLPDDIFKIKFSSLHVDGIGIEDLLNKKHIDIQGIYCDAPVIEVFHKRRVYNETERKNDTLTLYRRITQEANSIKAGRIQIGNGTFINHNLDKKNDVTNFNNISISMEDLLIDSTTQYDNNRFLFTKHTTFQTKNFLYPTEDGLYFFKAGSISVSAQQHTIVASDVELKPRDTKETFDSKLSERKEMYHLTFPKIVLNNVDWAAIINQEKFIAAKVDITGGTFYVYFNKSFPPKHLIKFDNFPDQVLMKMPIAVSIPKLAFHHFNVAFEEFNPDSKKSATVYFDDINGSGNNISNIPAEIKRSRYANVNAQGLFMHKISMKAKFRFDLSKSRTGEFTADIFMGAFSNTILNPIAEPLGLFSVTKGEMQKGIAHVQGNDFTIKSTVALYYSGLHITPYKKVKDNGKLKKKTFTTFFANALFIKNSNNDNVNQLREPEVSVARGKRSNFFSFLWTSILTGVLKTIGVPVKLALK